MLLQKPPAALEVYNDLDSGVVNFFRVLRERTEELLQAIELTPHSREELELAYEPAGDDLERARRFYVKAWQAFQGPSGQTRSGWRWQKNDYRGKSVVKEWAETDKLWPIVERLKAVQIEHDTALSVIDRYDSPETLFYLDPPYPSSTRGRWAYDGYQHEMSDGDHRELADVLHEIEGMAIISTKPNDLYEKLYADWEEITQGVRTMVCTMNTEVLYLSPAVAERRLPLLSWDPKVNCSGNRIKEV